jgi:hypothetical protein
MHVILQVAAATILLFVAQKVLRHASKWVLWSLFLVVPLVLTPYWLRVNDFGLFVWFKIYTILFCNCWGVLLRFTSLGQRSWARFTIALLLGANILEATTLDILAGGLAHNLNAVVGVLLIATIPFGKNALRIDETKRSRDLHFGISRGWLCGYTLWNWTFVYLNYPSFIGHHTAVLLSALIVGVIAPRLWLQARACTLGLNLLIMATCNNAMVSWLDTSNWSDDGLGIVAAGIALALGMGVAIRAILVAKRSVSNNPNKQYQSRKRSLSSAVGILFTCAW